MISNSNPQLDLIDQLSVPRPLSRVDTVLNKIDQLVDWQALTAPICATYASTGRPSIDAVLGVKCLLLSELYDLSYPELEDHGNDSIAFRRFLGLDLSGTMPDQSTLWRFRERLVEHHLATDLFEFVNRCLEQYGVILKRGTIIDATIVAAARKAPDPKVKADSSKPRGPQQDRDATRAKKRNQRFYGYKGSIGTDSETGIIVSQCFTTARVHDSKPATELIRGDEQAVYADKAYDNKRIRKHCADRGIACEILEQARKYHPLTPEQKASNKRKGKIRQRVERVFAHLKRVHRYRQVRSVTLLRNATDFVMLCIGYNLKRCTALLAG